MQPLQFDGAISRIGTPPTNFNRRTSRTWRMIVLSAGIRSLLWNSQRRGPESASRGHLPSRARSSRNGGRHHLGTVGGIISEWVGGIIPESWAACSGIRIGEHVGPVASHFAVVAVLTRVCKKYPASIVLWC